jgi:hypothetical protein
VEEKTVLPTTLTFCGELSLNSDAGKAVDIEKNFNFSKTRASHLLVTAGGFRPASELSVTGELFNKWKEVASKVGATAPVEGSGEALLIVETGGIRFLGLTVVSNAILRSKAFVLNHTPMYEFVLIKDDKQLTDFCQWSGFINSLRALGTRSVDRKTSARSLSKSDNRR